MISTSFETVVSTLEEASESFKKKLLEEKDFSIRDEKGRNIFHHYAMSKNNNLDASTFLANISSQAITLINDMDAEGRTPLYYAIMNGDLRLITEFINIGPPVLNHIDNSLDREVPSGKLPMHVGVVVQNVASAATIAEVPNQVMVRGHTDAAPWSAKAGTNNWRLSVDRAEVTRHYMEFRGIASERFARIEGVADREPYVPSDRFDPRNRRISITLGWRGFDN